MSSALCRGVRQRCPERARVQYAGFRPTNNCVKRRGVGNAVMLTGNGGRPMADAQEERLLLATLLGLRRAPGLRSTSGQLPRVARTAARRAQGQGPLSGPFGKAYCGVRWWHRERDKIDKIILLAMAQCPVGCGAFDFRGVLSPEGPGSDTSSGCLAQHRGPFSSRSTTSEEAKVKSEGKRTSSSSAGPGAEDKRQ